MQRKILPRYFLLSLLLPAVILSVSCGAGPRQGSDGFDLKSIAFSGDVTFLPGSDNPMGETCLRMTPSGELNLPLDSSLAVWDSSKYLVLDVLHHAGVSGAVIIRFFEQADSNPSFTALLGVMPGLRTRLVFPLSELDAHRVFLPRTPGRMKAVMWGRRTRPELLSAVTVSLDSMVPGQNLYLCRIGLSGSLPESYPVDGDPVVDSLGQWHARDWPGKTPDFQSLKSNLETALASAGGSAFPDDWSRFGGWKKLRFKPSGFFRVEKTAKRWWLADPEGCAFFSTGIDGVGPLHAGCPVDGIEKLFMWLPPKEGEFEPGWSRQWDQWSADFGGFNLIRAFGGEWKEKWTAISRSRMIDWRFNTLGNWSDETATREFGLPYVIPLRGFPEAGAPLYRDFPDVFDPEYEKNAQAWAAQLEPFRDDPLLIGYFLNNEPQWAFSRQLPAVAMLETGASSATRTALTLWLKERYKGDIGALNTAWGQSFSSFEALGQGSLRRPEEFSAQSRDDLAAFSELMVQRCLEPPYREARRADPNHLNLGIRWAGLGSGFLALAGQYCDVFTVNMYSMLPDTAALRVIAEQTGRPVLIGEYHFGATDRGLPSTGLRGVTDQTQRGVAYQAYVETAASMPWMVGTHYFIWNDQPVFGRFDGENYNIGVVDVCNTPYREFVDAARITHERIYGVASGEFEPIAERAAEVPRIGF